MDNKKLIAGFGYQEGRISSWDGKRTYTQAAPQMAKHCCDNGADEILIYDWSVTDDDHEAAIAVIKEVCREADAPVIAGGRVKRMEDVKKYLYAGASAVFLDMSKEENVDMIKEASDRFGKEKIYAYLPTDAYLDHVKDYKAQVHPSCFLIQQAAFPLYWKWLLSATVKHHFYSSYRQRMMPRTQQKA